MRHPRGKQPLPKPNRFYSASVWRLLCTPGMGVNLRGGSPLYENRKVFMVMNTNKSTSRRQGRLPAGRQVSARRGLEEAGAQSYEPTNRNSIQGRHPGKSAQHDEVPRIQEKR